jgi:hypothetical protein
MARRPTREEALRHESIAESFDDEEGFVTRESGYVPVTPKPSGLGKGRRTMEDMMASQPNDIMQSAYALERIAALEDQIARVLQLCTPEALELALKQRPSLRRYAPDGEKG